VPELHRPARRRLTLCGVLVLAAAVATCRDDPAGPAGAYRGAVAIAPVFAGGLDPADFGIVIDEIRAIVIRPTADTLLDRRVPFPADSESIALDLNVTLLAAVETLTVSLEYLGGGVVLFQGSRAVEVRSGPAGTTPADSVPVLYRGPGAGVDSLVVTPDSSISWGDSLRFRVAAFQGGVSVPQFYISWSTSSPTLVPISAAGVLHAPSRRDSVWVYARLPNPNPTADSARVRFQPVPSSIAIAGGNNQSASVGAALPQPLRVRVTAADAQGVGFVPVRFRVAMGGGSVADTLVYTDPQGFAETVATVGASAGPQVFEASFSPSQFVTFSATALQAVATRLEFTMQPTTATAGSPISPAVEVTARDGTGGVATGFAGQITIALLANPGSANLTGTLSANAVSGVATFTNLVLDKAATGYTLIATATSITPDTSAAFAVVARPPTELAFTVQPVTSAAGAPFTPAVQVTARDAFGNVATGFTGSVTVAIGTNPGSGTLSGAATQAAVGGIATFAGLSIDKVGVGYTLTAASGTLTGATSAAFDINPAPASELRFTAEPSTAVAGVAIAPAVVVTAYDPFGNIATGFAGTVTAAIGANPGSGTLAGTASQSASAGVATFVDLSINKAGVGYTLVASSSALTPATSAAFDITPAAAAELLFTVEPSTAVAGVAIAPAVEVTARDAFGNVATGFTGTVTLALGANPGSGTLSGTPAQAAAAGVATFADLSIDKAGVGYTLVATATALTPDTSAVFDITPAAAAELRVTAEPSTTVAGVAIAPPVAVTAFDAFGNVATGFTGNVDVAIATNPSDGFLSGTATQAAAAGVATFADLSIDLVGVGYTLAATATGLTPDTSAAFDITPAAAAELRVTAEPSAAVAGVALAPAVEVTAYDAFGNVATGFAGTVTAAIGTNPGAGTLAGTASQSASAGIAAFADLSIDKVGVGYTLVVTATGLTPDTSVAFDIAPAAAAQLMFTGQPNTAVAGVAIAPPVVVTALDAFGNVATGFNGNVAITIATNPSVDGILSGTTTQAAAAGIATFADLSIDKVGVGYTLATTATGLTPDTSTAFDITPAAASQLLFTVEPGPAVAGAAIAPAVEVTAYDQFGNLATGFLGSVTVALGANPSGATLSGTTTRAATAGVASFADLSLDLVGTGYALTANATGVSGATSVAFDVGAGSAARLVYTAEPSTAVAGVAIAPDVIVEAVDAFGNLATGFTGNVTMAIGANPGAGTLSGTATQAASAGVATFADLSIDKAGVGYTLVATSSALVPDTSVAFDITPAAAAQLVFTVEPSAVAAGAAITPAVEVTAQDAFGNTATGFVDSVFMAIATNPPSDGVLSGTRRLVAVAGVATFADLSIDLASPGYTIAATATGLTPDTSAAFDVTSGAISPATSIVTVSDSVVAVGATLTLSLQAYDQFSNQITTGGETIVFTASGGTSDGTISATTDHGDGTYTATYVGTTAGTEDTIGATINAQPVTTLPLPTVRVFLAQTVHSTDITANETWLAAGNPHIVTGYLRVLNNAALTIEDGAEVRFDAGAGLQIGDTNEVTLAQPGGLVMQGATGGITLTANTVSPAPGFWRGIEVQNSLTVPTWTKVLIEWAGGTRPPQSPSTEACVLVVNDQGLPFGMDSVTIRQCVHAGIHLFGGNLQVRRSRIDSVTGSGIHVDFKGRLAMDSTRIVGSGGEGLLVASPTAGLTTNEFNKFIGNQLASVRIQAPQLRGFKQQDSIVANGLGPGGFGDSVVVDGGLVDGGGTQFRLFAQAAPYLVLGHLKMVNAPIILMPGLVMAFDQTAGFQFGDSTAGNDTQLMSQGTAANPVLLTSRGAAPGWPGLYLGRQSGPVTLSHVHIANGGYSPVPTQAAANLLVEAAGGSGPINVDGMTSINSRNHGVVILSAPVSGFTVRDDTIHGSAGMGLAIPAPATVNDSIVRNLITPSNGYPLGIEIQALPGLGANTYAPNTRDTLLLLGGTLAVPATLPHVAGVPWRVVTNVDINGGALDVLADTVFFDDSVEVRVGGTQPGGLRAVGATPWRKLFSATPGHTAWWGIEYRNIAPGGAAPFTTLTNVVVEEAGHYEPCFGDCNPIPHSGLRFYNQSTTNVTFDSIVVRLARSIALDAQPTGTSVLTVLRSQFYANPFSPMIQGPPAAATAPQFAIHTSDLYYYGSDVVRGPYGAQLSPADSIDATGNWWGDAAGAYPGFSFQDSLGRASLSGYAVRTVSFASVPFFQTSLGPAAEIRSTTDTSLIAFPRHTVGQTIGNPDSLRVRVLDAMGRGVGGTSVNWSVSVGNGTLSSLTGTTATGGRSPGVTVTAGSQSGALVVDAVSAGLLGSPVRFTDSLTAGATVSTNWQIVQAGAGGTISSGLDSVSYTSSNMTTVLVTHAVDQFGNVTVPSSFYFFTDVPNSGFRSYGIVDSTKGDTVFFRPQVVSPGTYQLHGLYDGGLMQDSVIITVETHVAGLEITWQNFQKGMPDTSAFVFTSICPTIGPCGFNSARDFHVSAVDSGGAVIPDAAARFTWAVPPFPDTTITRDSVFNSPVEDQVFLSAHAPGTSWLVAVDTSSLSMTSGMRDSLPILVDQVGQVVLFTPDSASILVGDTATLQAYVADGDLRPLPNEIVHFRTVSFAPGSLTFTDTSKVNLVTVRVDSTPFGSTYVEAFWPRPLKDTLYGYFPGDTVLGYAQVFNPVQIPVDVGGINPYGVGINEVTSRAYVAHAGDALVGVVSTTSNTVITTIDVPAPTLSVAVNPKTNRIYVTEYLGSTRIWAIDGATNLIADSGSLGGFFAASIAVDTARNRVYGPGNICVVVPGPPPQVCLNTDFLTVLDGATLSVVDTVRIGNQGISTAYNPVTDRIYVVVGTGPVDTVKVIDATTLTVVDSIEVGQGAFGIAINPATNKIYVTNESDGTVSVIDGATNSVTATIQIGSFTYPEGIGVDRVRNLVYVSHAGDSYVTIVDGATNAVLGTLYMGGISTDAQPDPVTGRVFVPMYDLNQLRVLRYALADRPLN